MVHQFGQLLIILIATSCSPCASQGDISSTQNRYSTTHQNSQDSEFHSRIRRSVENTTDDFNMDQYFVELMNAPVTPEVLQNATCNEYEDLNCIIDHNITCVGDPMYCNLTYNEYMDLLYDYIFPTVPEWILIFSHSIVFLMGLVGNALVCIAVYTNHSMRTVTNIFIVNLAVADFFVILFCLPPTVVWDVTETWFMGKTMCKIVLYFQEINPAIKRIGSCRITDCYLSTTIAFNLVKCIVRLRDFLQDARLPRNPRENRYKKSEMICIEILIGGLKRRNW
ncbi:G protein-coupled receptor, rhodopsin-like [Sergentomyia squamirostris]